MLNWKEKRNKQTKTPELNDSIVVFHFRTKRLGAKCTAQGRFAQKTSSSWDDSTGTVRTKFRT